MIYLILFIVFCVLLTLYFRIANYFNIIDHPNERSSHSIITIRGGGIIFLFSILTGTIIYPQYWLICLAALVIGLISFFDDILTLSSRIRISVHLIAVTLLFIALGVFTNFAFYEYVFFYFLVVGVINAYNFMDGINGITGTYSLVILAGLQWVNIKQINFITPDLIWFPCLACVVFLLFNFRKTAKCFAGDVGSVTIAFWIMMLLLKLIFLTHNWVYIGFLAVYGVDSTLTIVHRLILKQNVFKAHRMHLYQLLANEYKIPHLIIATVYTIIQLLIIGFIILNKQLSGLLVFTIILMPLIAIYVILKKGLTKKAVS